MSSENPTVFEYNFNNLDDNHPKSGNVAGIDINLMSHQKTSLYHCQVLENEKGFRINYKEPEYYQEYIKEHDILKHRDFCPNFGIIADKVGSGKSFVVLGLIRSRQLVNFTRVISDLKSNLANSFKQQNTVDVTVATNILLVPHNLFNQWKTYITEKSDLDATFIGTKKEFTPVEKEMIDYQKMADGAEKTASLNQLTNNKLYLISGKMWNNFADCWNKNIQKKASRVFVDEVHSINVPNTIRIKSNFIWFITSSVADIGGHKNTGFIRDVIDSYHNLSKQYQNFLIIKNKDAYIDSSLKLPAPKETTIRCRSSVILGIFNGIINQEVKDMLLAEDVNGVVKYLGIKAESESEIIGKLCTNLENELANARLNLDFKKQMMYNSEQAKKDAISRAQEKIKNLEEKINSVKTRITESNIDPIMHIDIENPVITDCCKNKFELESITSYYEFKEKKGDRNITCPMCRQKLDIKKLIYVGDVSEEKKEVATDAPPEWKNEEHTKMENLQHLLSHTISTDKKILIFSEHEGNFDSMKEIFAKAGRPNLSPVKGTITHITSLINSYNSGDIPNLFLNAKYCGSGLNLQTTDAVIIMHKMTEDNIKQVIGRAQRIGRQGQLQVFFLYTDTE